MRKTLALVMRTSTRSSRPWSPPSAASGGSGWERQVRHVTSRHVTSRHSSYNKVPNRSAHRQRPVPHTQTGLDSGIMLKARCLVCLQLSLHLVLHLDLALSLHLHLTPAPLPTPAPALLIGKGCVF